MIERALAVIHDPRGLVSVAEARRRVTRALDGDGRYELHQHGALSAAWTGRPGGRAHDDPVVAVDGSASIDLRGDPAAWPALLRATRGSFAVVAWDGCRGMLARDHLGVRPLFYAAHGAVLHAASEVGMVLRMLPVRPAPDEQAIARWLSGRTVSGGAELFTGVCALPPAHALMLEDASRRLERYWAPVARTGLDGATADEAAGMVRDAVRGSVRGYMAGRERAGVLLSGGLDSSAILACAAAEAQEAGVAPPAAFSVVFPDRAELDESAASGAVAAHWRASWRNLPAARGSVMPYLTAHLERFALPLENPNGAFFAPAPAAAAADGVRILLDGEGGDELFGCEPLLIADRVLRGQVRRAWQLACALPGTGGRIDRRSARIILRRWVLPGLIPPRPLDGLRRLRHPRPTAPGWLGPAGRAAAAAAASPDGGWWRAGEPRWSAHLAWRLTDWRADLGVQDRLRRGAALAGVDGAHPLLDVDLVELVLGLAPELSFDPHLDRPLLRRAMRGWLPEPVRLRPDKVFFTALVLDALTGPDRPVVDAVLRDRHLELAPLIDASRARELWTAGPDRHPDGPWAWSLEVWRLLAVEIWLRREAGRAQTIHRN